LVRTPISSQRALPLKIPAPKSNGTVKRPLVTPTAKLVMVPPIWLPPLGALDSEN
jgi:hypothetical protein